MMNNKVLVTINVPSLEKSFDIFIPVNRRVHNVIALVKKSLYDLSGHSFQMDGNYVFYNAETGAAYDMNSLIRDTDIRNNAKLILL